MSSELKSKLEEERDLKKEVDKLEYEVLQSDKVQDNIDNLQVKLRNLCKCKQGDFIKDKHKSMSKSKKETNTNQMCDKMGLAL